MGQFGLLNASFNLQVTLAYNAVAPACVHQAWVVRKVDNTIHWINHYPADSVLYFVTLIRWIVIDPVDSVIQPSENRALMSNLKYYPKC